MCTINKMIVTKISSSVQSWLSPLEDVITNVDALCNVLIGCGRFMHCCADRLAYDINVPRIQTAPHALAVHQKYCMRVVASIRSRLLYATWFNVIGALVTFRLKDCDGTVNECLLAPRVTLAGTIIKSFERCLSRVALLQITKIWSTMFHTIFTGGEWLRVPATKVLR